MLDKLRQNDASSTRAGFTLIEVIAVLLLLGLLVGLGGSALISTVQGYFLARDSAAVTQKAELALTRLTNEFRICYDCIGSGEDIDLPFLYHTSRGARTVSVSGDTVEIDGDVLVDQVSAFTLAYDDMGRIHIQLGLNHPQGGCAISFETWVLPRNTYE